MTAIFTYIILGNSFAQEYIKVGEYNLTFLMPQLIKWKSSNGYKDMENYFWSDGENIIGEGRVRFRNVGISVELADRTIFQRQFIGKPIFDNYGRFKYCESEESNDYEYRVTYMFTNEGKCYTLDCYENTRKYPDFRREFEQMANSVSFSSTNKEDIESFKGLFTPAGQRFCLKDYKVSIVMPNIINWKPSYLVYDDVTRYIWNDKEYLMSNYFGEYPTLSVQFETCAIDFSDLGDEIKDSLGKEKCTILEDQRDSSKYKAEYYFHHDRKCYELFCSANLKKYPDCKAEFRKIALSVTFDKPCDSVKSRTK